MSRSALRLPALVAVALVLVAGSAHAAVTRVLGPLTLFGEGRAFVKFDAAHDSIHRVNLVVYGTQAAGPVNGILLNESGAPLTSLFAVSDGAQQSGWARVTFSHEQGKFLVSYVRIMGPEWHQKVARFISVTDNKPVLGAEMILDEWRGGAGTATGLAYAAASGKFFVSWSRYYGSFPVSFVSVIDPAGSASAPIIVSDPGDGESDPEIACDPVSRRCLMVGTAWGIKDGSGKSTFWGRFIDDATGTPLGPSSVYLLRVGGLMDPAAVVYSSNPSQFLMGLGFGGIIMGLVADGASQTFGVPFNMIQDTTNTQGVGYGFVSMRFNPQSQTTIATMTTWIGFAAVQELTGAGGRTANGFDLIPDTPDVASKPWDTANQFTVPVTNAVTGGFLALENHYFKAMRVSVYGGAPVAAAPVVTQHPQSVNVRNGVTVTFAAAASGGPAPGIQWQVKAPGSDFANVAGATGSTFVVSARRTDSGKLFRAVFSNASGSATSTAAILLVAPPAANDLDGDGKSDALVWRASTGTWYWATSSLTNAITPTKQWGNAALGDIALTGDLDGDAAADIVVWRPTDGTWYWLTSSNGYNVQNAGALQWGINGDVPLLADMDGDGISDFVIWRPSNGTWSWLTSSTGYAYAGQRNVAWGTAGDIPLTGDFDGDGRADLAIWRPSGGMWYYLTSTTGYAYSAQKLKWWGAPGLGDQPFLTDFDGDRRADFAIWRASTGTWYWLTSSTGYNPSFAGAIQWGNAALRDVPLLNDFDGDGLADFGVFRESTGVWYWLPSSSGYSYAAARSRLFGGPGDMPVVR